MLPVITVKWIEANCAFLKHQSFIFCVSSHKVLAYMLICLCAYMSWPTKHDSDINIEEHNVLIFVWLMSGHSTKGTSFFLLMLMFASIRK